MLSRRLARMDWPRSTFYWFYFSALGALVPYWPLYLRARGFGPRALGYLMAILAVSRVLAPHAGGFLSDHLGHRVAVVRLAAFLAFVAILLMGIAHTFLAVAVVMAAFSFFWYATLPPLEASTLAFHGDHYGRVRLWGSLGFIVVVLALGPVLDREGPAILLPVVAILLFGLWLATLTLPRLSEAPGETARLVTKPGLALFLLACFLMQMSYGPYYTFYSVYLAHYGYSKTDIGVLWALGVICEVGIFWQAGRLLARFSERSLFAFTFALAVLRWILIARFPRILWILAVAQVFHAFTFGLYHAVAVRLARRYVGPGAGGRAQAFYGSAAGGGAAIGAVMSGYLWSSWGREATFLWAAVVAAVAFGVVLLTPAPHPERPL